MLIFLGILVAIFFITLIINKTLAKKLAMERFYIYVLNISFQAAKKDGIKIPNIDVSKWQLFKFALFILGYMFRYFIFEILSYIMNISLLLVTAIIVFFPTHITASFFTSNEEILIYVGITAALLCSLYGAGLYSRLYIIFGTKDYKVSQRVETEDCFGIKEFADTINKEYNFKEQYIKLFDLNKVKTYIYIIVAVLVIITSIKRLGGDTNIFGFEWWNLIIGSGYETAVTFIAVDRFVSFVKSEKDTSKKAMLYEKIAKFINDKENESG